MPLGWERLNERQQRPNEKIVFIKPLEGPDKSTAHDFLSRIAAQCAPIMKSNYLSVVSLEEFEPNKEFWGRNFNAGECIQLVLKSPSTGRWLPFKFVQMVMMHELAHCQQMNHSRAFWAVRNTYASEMRVLWDKGYTGDGLWGRGQALYDGQYTNDTMPAAEEGPTHLCGGVYRTGRGKRKRHGTSSDKPKLSYAERQQRRIDKKFGIAGTGATLGGNDLIRTALEKGKANPGTKPRVAQSKRGRELRAAAALARLEKKPDPAPAVEDDATESETESDDELMVLSKEQARDAQGNKILDSHGHGMVKVCEDEEKDDVDAQQELEELGQLTSRKVILKNHEQRPAEIEESSTESEDESEIKPVNSTKASLEVLERQKDEPSIAADTHSTVLPHRLIQQTSQTALPQGTAKVAEPTSAQAQASAPAPGQAQTSASASASTSGICPICSLENDPSALTCMACAHVLRPGMMAHWACKSEECRTAKSVYINAGDNRRCGICGIARDV